MPAILLAIGTQLHIAVSNKFCSSVLLLGNSLATLAGIMADIVAGVDHAVHLNDKGAARVEENGE